MGPNKKIFFTSDWHLGQKAIIYFSKRPFSSADEMDEKLVQNYKATVPEKNSVCFFLGDMGNSSTSRFRTLISTLPGTKILILGNHDKGVSSMYDTGFDVVIHGATLVIAGQKVTMTHCPLAGVYREDTDGMATYSGSLWHGDGDPKKERFTTPDYGQFHLHGHIHSPNSGRSQKTLGRQYDVGVDANNFRPVSISRIETWISKALRDEKKST